MEMTIMMVVLEDRLRAYKTPGRKYMCGILLAICYKFTYKYTCLYSTVAESPIADQQAPLPGSTQQPSTGQPTAISAAAVGGAKLESGSGSSLKSGQSAADNNKTSSDGSSQRQSQEQEGSASAMASSGEKSTASIFLQTAAYLLDIHALKVLHIEYMDMHVILV